MADFEALKEAVIKGNQGDAVSLTQSALDEGVAPEKVLSEGLVAGMNVIGGRFKKNEVFVPEVMIAARAMKSAMEVLEPKLVEAGIKPVGTVVIGTVQGDLHDIGKNLVAMMLRGAGFNVVDLGTNVSPDAFLAAVKENNAGAAGLSALLTTTMPMMEKTVHVLKDSGVGAKIMVGGAPVTKDYAEKIGAQGYAPDAASAVDVARELISA